MLAVTLFFYLAGEPIVNFMNSDVHARHFALQALRTISLGYVFFGVCMVMLNAFNGAGDTTTPTLVNLVGFWLFQIPLAWVLSQYYIKEPKAIFITILISQFVTALLSFYLFKRGKWKLVKV
jgi:Na+-driven multidrug efflux pump